MREGTSKERAPCAGFFYFKNNYTSQTFFVDCWYIHSLTCLFIVCACIYVHAYVCMCHDSIVELRGPLRSAGFLLRCWS